MSAETEEHGEGAPKFSRFSIKWILIATAIGIGIYLLPTPDGMSDRAHRYPTDPASPGCSPLDCRGHPIGVTANAAGAAILGLF